MRRVSMATRDELLMALAARYRGSGRADKTRILDEFASVTGYHRKHAMRLLRAGPPGQAPAARPERRVYNAALREALIVLWEASDRICGKRLKAMIPTLLPAMERHGYLDLMPEIRAALLAISAARHAESTASGRALGNIRVRQPAQRPGTFLNEATRHLIQIAALQENREVRGGS